MNKAALWLIPLFLTCQVQAQSDFESTLQWSNSSSQSGIAGKGFFIVDDNFVTVFQIILEDPIGEAQSLEPVFQLSNGSVPFTLSLARHFSVNDFSWDYEPFLGYMPFEIDAPDPIRPLSGTSYRFSFEGTPGLESQLLTQGGIFQITINGTGDPGIDGSTISGPLISVPTPEPKVSMLLATGFVMIITSNKFRNYRKQI